MKNKNIPENFMISERGVRKSARHCPHSMAFPAMMSALKAFMGLPQSLLRKELKTNARKKQSRFG